MSCVINVAISNAFLILNSELEGYYTHNNISLEGPMACVLGHCGKELIACEADQICKTWSNCNQGCGLDVSALECQIRCGDLYKPTDETSAKIVSFE